MLSNSDNFESIAEEILKKAIGDIYTPFNWLGYVPFDPRREEKSPPPEPVAVEVDPVILAAYAGAYDMQPHAVFEFKLEDNCLFIYSKDEKRWDQLIAENEVQFFVKGHTEFRFNFLRDDAGTVIALQFIFHGIPMPLAMKVC